MISCTKKETPVTGVSLDDYLKSQQDLSLFSQLVEKAGVSIYKDGAGPFTWFAPTNDGFAAAQISADSINKMTSNFANYLLMYHLTNGSLRKELDFTMAFSIPRATQIGNTATTQVHLGRNKDSIYVNGATIVRSDVVLNNGFLHVINKFNTPPAFNGNLQNIITNTGRHSLFIAALQKAGLWTQFGGSSIFTILAPTDAAMIAAGYPSTTAINALSGTALTSLTNVCRYHYFVGARFFSNDFKDGRSPLTALNPRAFVISNNGTLIRGTNNTTPGGFSSINNLGTNGVIHSITTVLLP